MKKDRRGRPDKDTVYKDRGSQKETEYEKSKDRRETRQRHKV